MITINSFKQHDPEWYELKTGVPSSSNFDRILSATGKTGSQDNYIKELAGQALGGIIDHYESYDMKRGTELEPKARESYSFDQNVMVAQPALIFKDEKRQCLCSPDGICFENGEMEPYTGLEIKCLKIHNHVDIMLKRKMPIKYFCQVQGCMYITGFESWDFVSFYPGLDPFISTITRDDEWINKFHDELQKFLEKLDGVVNKLRRG